MSRRESMIKAIAAALQPKGLDLTQFARARVATKENNERALKVSAMDAAGALAFQAAGLAEDSTEDVDETVPHSAGDRLASLLLRLKYADQWSKDLFTQAHLLLLHRHGSLARREPSGVMAALAFTAVAEWVHDRCPKCRPLEPRENRTMPCPQCRPVPVRLAGKPEGRRELVEVRRKAGKAVMRAIATMTPKIGCPKCHGIGRVFVEPRAPRGMVCRDCHNSGRVDLSAKQRLDLVNDFLETARRAQGGTGRGLHPKLFRDHWAPRYYRLLDKLRTTDKDIAAGLDLGFTASYGRGGLDAEEDEPDNREHSLEPQEEEDRAPAERPVGQAAGHEPENETGPVPPKFPDACS